MKHKSTQEWGRNTAKERYGTGPVLADHPADNDALQAPQDPQDKHESTYNNDSNGADEWTRGMGPKSPYPNFDRKNAWRTGKVEDNS